MLTLAFSPLLTSPPEGLAILREDVLHTRYCVCMLCYHAMGRKWRMHIICTSMMHKYGTAECDGPQSQVGPGNLNFLHSLQTSKIPGFPSMTSSKQTGLPIRSSKLCLLDAGTRTCLREVHRYLPRLGR